ISAIYLLLALANLAFMASSSPGLQRTKRPGATSTLMIGNGVSCTLWLSDGIDNRYYFGGPQSIPNAPLWGYPRVECEAVTAGNMWLGDWRKCVLFDREQATISLSDSHSDFFIRNMVAILAEMRAALGFIRPSAFIQVPLEAGS
ncbi:MAG: phage major capsid protein, partial [Dehalococcoidia bacterium]|nr:phage major capsid protein [Dehalococcoidia bacterium]